MKTPVYVVLFLLLLKSFFGYAAESCPGNETEILYRIREIQIQTAALAASAVHAHGYKSQPSGKAFCWWVGGASEQAAGISAKIRAITPAQGNLTGEIILTLGRIEVNAGLLNVFCQTEASKFGSEQEAILQQFLTNINSLAERLDEGCASLFM